MDSILNQYDSNDEDTNTHKIDYSKNVKMAPVAPSMARALRSLKNFVGVAQIVCIRAATINFRQARPSWHRQIVPAGTSFFFIKYR